MLNEKTVATTAPYQDSKPSVPALLACAFQSDQSTPYQQRGVHLLKKYFTAQALGGFLVWGGRRGRGKESQNKHWLDYFKIHLLLKHTYINLTQDTGRWSDTGECLWLVLGRLIRIIRMLQFSCLLMTHPRTPTFTFPNTVSSSCVQRAAGKGGIC